MRRFLKENGLSIAFLILFVLSMTGQLVTGFSEYNKDNVHNGLPAVSITTYLQSGHFLQSTFENWESEFLQMALFVLLTISLRQKGSSESKSLIEAEEVDREPDPAREGAPAIVKKGGWRLTVYKHSLSIALSVLFILSFLIHFYGSLRDENEQLAADGLPRETVMEYITGSRFWFESFQNWQSEFLSVFAIVVLSIYLRQKGSSQSKPVDAPHMETGS